jgi:hypothetical protein
MKPSPYLVWKRKWHERLMSFSFVAITFFLGFSFIDDVDLEGDGY